MSSQPGLRSEETRGSHINVGILWRCCSGQGPHLAKTLEPCGSSRVAAGF